MRLVGGNESEPFSAAGASERSDQNMSSFISLSVAVLALYGDLLKRVLPPVGALAAQYVFALLIFFFVLRSAKHISSRNIPVISSLSGILILVYFLQFSTNLSADLMTATMMMTYICTPLLFTFLIPRVYPKFDLYSLARYTALLIIPIHSVGLIQEFYDSGFLVSTEYSVTGGVIARNFLDGTDHFMRFPSLFASADRYAGVSAVQFLLSFVLFNTPSMQTKKTSTLFAFSLLESVVGLLIAGARSRILVSMVVFLIGGVTFLMKAGKGRALMFRGSVMLVVVIAAGLTIDEVRNNLFELPILRLLTQTAEQDDIGKRFQEGLEVNEMPANVTMFGRGLGAESDGRPGEFAIRAMWIEGGIFWTYLMLVFFLVIEIWLIFNSARRMFSGDAVGCMIMAAGAIYWLFGILAGLSGVFELSFALLFFPMIATVAIPQGSRANR